MITSPEEIYDMLMREIEPELTSEFIDTLEEKYKNETPEEAEGRGKRYKKAFDRFEEAFAKYLMELNASVQSYRKSAFRSVEEESRGEDAEKMSAIEDFFGSGSS